MQTSFHQHVKWNKWQHTTKTEMRQVTTLMHNNIMQQCEIKISKQSEVKSMELNYAAPDLKKDVHRWKLWYRQTVRSWTIMQMWGKNCHISRGKTFLKKRLETERWGEELQIRGRDKEKRGRYSKNILYKQEGRKNR